MQAAMNGNYPVVSLLIRKGANPQLKSKEGKTARKLAQESLAQSEAGGDRESIKELKKEEELRKIVELLPEEGNDGDNRA